MEHYERGLVSAVTPVYNGEAHLHTLLDALLAQTYPRMEIILVDDGSTDGTAAAEPSGGRGGTGIGPPPGYTASASSAGSTKTPPLPSTEACPL